MYQLPAKREKRDCVRVTIDSTEALDDVLRVVGALYGVQLAVAEGDSPPVRLPAPRGERSASKKPQAARGSGRPPGRIKAPVVSSADVRTWARSQGHDVSDRGRIRAEILQAYQAAHT